MMNHQWIELVQIGEFFRIIRTKFLFLRFANQNTKDVYSSIDEYIKKLFVINTSMLKWSLPIETDLFEINFLVQSPHYSNEIKSSFYHQTSVLHPVSLSLQSIYKIRILLNFFWKEISRLIWMKSFI